MHLTKCIMAPTDSGSCNETVEVIVVAVGWGGGIRRISKRDCEENTNRHSGTGWLRNSIHRNVRYTHAVTANMTNVPPLPLNLSQPC